MKFAAAYFSGLFLGLSLIIAIGAQNAFVLRQGLRREYVLAVCLICAVSDAVLIAAGVAGFGQLVTRLPWLQPVMRILGAAFLCLYAVRSALAALRAPRSLSPLAGATTSFKKIAGTALAFTWLNPHVYLDTVVLLGSVSTQYAGQRVLFALGAMTGSFGFFFALGYGARLLRPLFAKPVAWRVLDGLVAFVMFGVALELVA